MNYPRAASRHPLKGAMPVARRSRFHGILGLGISRRVEVRCLFCSSRVGRDRLSLRSLPW